MRILIVGATGTIGEAVVAALQARHELVLASRSKSAERVDVTNPASIEALYRKVGKVDAVIGVAGEAAWKPLVDLTDEDFAFSLRSKLMGQVNLVRRGIASVADGGSFTLTSGVLATHPTPGGAAITLVNSAVDAFVRAAALELPRGIRINSVSPPWVAETLTAMGRDPAGGLPARDVARSYVEGAEGKQTGMVITPKRR
jgi:NAD(P)-dependent dehydrogenase (short-subunit alcohol dehydrogenase family)